MPAFSIVFFVRSGYVSIGVSRFSFSGVYGFSWSKQSYSSTTTVNTLYFNIIDTISSYNANRWGAFPFRCLAD